MPCNINELLVRVNESGLLVNHSKLYLKINVFNSIHPSDALPLGRDSRVGHNPVIAILVHGLRLSDGIGLRNFSQVNDT